jgi:ppGpp synthetase/RelA/SpoT-type nucleotidyltranferase
MQDIAGARVVLDISRSEQDDLVRSIVELFPSAKVVDRRAKPSHGYRAVHVIVSMDDRLVEVQVRTELQNQWAQLMERLADQWGRQIRYGAPLDDPLAKVGEVTRQRVIDLVMQVAEAINVRETSGEFLKAATATIEEAQKILPEGSESLVRMVERRAKLQSSTAQGDQTVRRVLRELDSIFGAGS